MKRVLGRLALVAGGFAMAGIGGEVALRTVHDELPSLAAATASGAKVTPFPSRCPIHGDIQPRWLSHWLEDALAGEVRPLDQRRSDDACWEPEYVDLVRFEASHPGGVRRPQASTVTPTFRLVVGGDSIVAGVGSAAGGGMSDVLGRELGAALGEEVGVDNLGTPGAGYCAVTERMRQRLDEAADAAVLVLFADDLEDRSLLSLEAGAIAFPSRIEHPIGRALASHSYLANRVWFASMTHAPQPIQRWIAPSVRTDFVAAVAGVVDAAEEAGVPLLVALLAPASMSLCEDPAPALSPCTWLEDDLDLMASLLDDAGVPYLDLRDFWPHNSDYVWENEAMDHRPGEPGTHPNFEGHALLGQALARALLPLVAEP